MSFMFLLLWVIVSACCITALIRQYAISRDVLDIPNQRSSHSVATPRGGGLSIVVSFLAAYCWFFFTSGTLSGGEFWALFGAGSLIAALGFMDDHGHIAARWRLLGHFAAAIWALVCLGGLPVIELMGRKVALGWVGGAFGVLYLVWLLNLYNFMDGIDGLASVEALFVCAGASLLYNLTGHEVLTAMPLLLATAVAGFLVWNFPLARIFMGDAGSGFLGITLGVLSIQGANVEPRFLWLWVILLGVFIVDATFTLMRRLARGDKVYQAHRSHAYQHAARRYGRHSTVTMAVFAINVFWLFPIAYAVIILGLNGLLGVVLAYVPLVWLALRYHAGAIEGAPRE